MPPNKEGSSTTPTAVSSNSILKQLNDSTIANQITKALPGIRKMNPSISTEDRVTETLKKPPVETSREIFSFSMGKSPMSDCSKLKNSGSSLVSDDNAKIRNDMDQGASKTAQKLNDIPKRSNLTLKGINFLSFRKVASENTCSRELENSPSNRNHQIEEQPYPSNKVGSLGGQNASSKKDKSNENPGTSQSASSPFGVNFLSFGKASSDNFGRKGQTSSHTSLSNGAEGSHQEQNSSHNVNFSSVPWRLLGSPLTSSQSSNIVPSNHKTAPNSGQKSLLSTLAFASKFEAQMKMKGTTGASAFGSGTN